MEFFHGKIFEWKIRNMYLFLTTLGEKKQKLITLFKKLFFICKETYILSRWNCSFIVFPGTMTGSKKEILLEVQPLRQGLRDQVVSLNDLPICIFLSLFAATTTVY